MTQDYLDRADKMLRDSGCYPRERALVIAALARSLAIHDAELLRSTAARLTEDAGMNGMSAMLCQYANEIYATMRENVGEGRG